MSRAGGAITPDDVSEIYRHWEHLRPPAWIARELWIPETSVWAALALIGVRRSGRFMPLERYDQLERAVEDEWSDSEIFRTYRTDPRTLDKWFPHRRRLPRGGGSEQAVLHYRGSRFMNERSEARGVSLDERREKDAVL